MIRKSQSLRCLLLLLLAVPMLLATSEPAKAYCDCRDCYKVRVPWPDGTSTLEPICWEDEGGWRACTEVGSTCSLFYLCSTFSGGCEDADPFPRVDLENPEKDSREPRLAETSHVEVPDTCLEPETEQEVSAPRIHYTM